jgi:hypothetical protein
MRAGIQEKTLPTRVWRMWTVIPGGFDPVSLLLLIPTEKQRCHLADPGVYV